MTDKRPEPLLPADTDIRDLDGFMLNTERLMASELWAISTGDEFKAAVGLWCRAWKQTPPGSLPNDERVLASFSGAGSNWKKVRVMALRGFIECSDGRLYHVVLCADVIRAAQKKIERREKTRAATEARQRQRDEERQRLLNDKRNDQRDVDREALRVVPLNVHPETGQDRDGTFEEASQSGDIPGLQGDPPPRTHAHVSAREGVPHG